MLTYLDSSTPKPVVKIPPQDVYFHEWKAFIEGAGHCSLPAQTAHVALYVTNLLKQNTDRETIATRLYSIQFVHEMNAFEDPTATQLTKRLFEAARPRTQADVFDLPPIPSVAPPLPSNGTKGRNTMGKWKKRSKKQKKTIRPQYQHLNINKNRSIAYNKVLAQCKHEQYKTLNPAKGNSNVCNKLSGQSRVLSKMEADKNPNPAKFGANVCNTASGQCKTEKKISHPTRPKKESADGNGNSTPILIDCTPNGC